MTVHWEPHPEGGPPPDARMYRPRIADVTAVQITCRNIHAVARWAGGLVGGEEEPELVLETVEGGRRLLIGDWVYRDLRGFWSSRHSCFVTNFDPAPAHTTEHQ